MDMGFSADDVLLLANNAIDALPDLDSFPKPIARLIMKIRDSGWLGSSSSSLMHLGIATKLTTRLVRAGI